MISPVPDSDDNGQDIEVAEGIYCGLINFYDVITQISNLEVVIPAPYVDDGCDSNQSVTNLQPAPVPQIVTASVYMF